MFATKIQDKRNEEGFTLIELLVVVIIIGILAAIAIPTFLSQRERGWQAELTSTVRNAALEAEAAATAASGSYAGLDAPAVTAFANAIQGEDTDPVTLTLISSSETAFEICGTHANLNDGAAAEGDIRYQSANGGLQDFDPTGDCS